MYEDFLRERLTQLRLIKGVSEYKMSKDLGHSKNYIQNISSKRTLPSITEFFYICDYLEVSPLGFFNAEIDNPALVEQAIAGMITLNDDDLQHLIYFIKRLNENK